MLRLRNRGIFLLLSAIVALTLLSVPGLAKTKLTLWDWHEPRVALYKEMVKEYQKVRPDVEIAVNIMPWDEYWSKLAVSVTTNTAPDIAEFHNEQYARFAGMLAPFPKDLFPLDEMRKKYIMFDQAFNFEGNMYYSPGGLMTGGIFYNVALLEQAGIPGVPDSWDETVTVAKKLTKIAGDGTLKQAGFSFAHDAGLLVDMIYQHGGWLFGEKGVAFAEKPGQQAILLFERLMRERISDMPSSPLSGNFESGKVAMRYSWTWFGGYLKNFPSIEWDVAPIPTPTGKNLPARGRNNYESELSVPIGVPKERQRLAFEFIKWLSGNDSFDLRLNRLLGRIPARPALWSHPDVKNDRTFRMLAKQVPYTVYAGPIPGWMWDGIGAMHGPVYNEKKAAVVALEEARQLADGQFHKNPPKYIVERKYSPPTK